MANSDDAQSDNDLAPIIGAGDADLVPGEQGEPATEFEPDADAGAERMTEFERDHENPGDAAGVVVPSDHASQGTSEEHEAVDGVRVNPSDQ